MANQDLEKLIVKLDADLRSYEKALAKAQGVTQTQMRNIERQVQVSATKVEGSFAKIEDIFKNFGRGILAGAGIGGIEELGRTILEAVSKAAKLDALSEKIGLNTDALQGLHLGAVQADMSFEDMDKTLLRFSKTLGEAANGQGEYLKTLRANGQQIQGSFLGNLQQLADLVHNAKNEQEALLIVTQAMGKGSDGWLEVLKKGSGNLQQLGEEAQKAGGHIDKELFAEARKLDEEWAKLMSNMTGYTEKFAINAAKTIGDIFGNAGKISDSLMNGDMRGFFFGHEGGLSGAIGDFLLGKETKDTTTAPAPVSNAAAKADRLGKTTKAFNPEDAEKQKRAIEALTRAIKQQFDTFTNGLTRSDEQTAALRLQAETMGKTAGEIARMRTEQELLNVANRAGLPVDAALNAEIERKANAAADAAQALDDLQQRQEVIDGLNSTLKDSFSSFVDDIRSGIDPVEALTNALGHLAEQLTNLAIDTAFTALTKPGGPAAGGIGGLLGKLFGFAKGGIMTGRGPVPLRSYAGGGVANSPQLAMYGEGSRPEAFVPLPDGKRIPVNLNIPSLSGTSRGGGMQVNVYNNGPGQARTQERNGPNGMKVLDVYIEQKVGQFIGSQKGARIMGAAYGLRPKQTVR